MRKIKVKLIIIAMCFVGIVRSIRIDGHGHDLVGFSKSQPKCKCPPELPYDTGTLCVSCIYPTFWN